ncbi:MAG: peptide chain release factor N(5)-glutamine methyltransferase [Rickettsiales bacterium]|nr:peptide chain release factor N(5)-glutamine methyltransferase [Rickettsiales bacterium]
MVTVKNKLAEASNLLKTRGIGDTPLLDCRILLAHTLSTDVDLLTFHMAEELSVINLEIFNSFVDRRVSGEPVSKIIGKKNFWNYEFFVNGEVLDPREDSETLIEAVLEDFPRQRGEEENMKILELGIGSGCLLLTLLKLFANAEGIGVDISEKSLEVARKNAEILGVKNVNMILANWNSNLHGQFDIIVSNPPYVKRSEINSLQNEIRLYEPAVALDGGADGLECFRQISSSIGKNMHSHSKIYIEIGYGQKESVSKIFIDNGFKFIRTRKDLRQIDRVLVFGAN